MNNPSTSIALFCRFLFLALSLVGSMAFALGEIEENDTPETAQDLGNKHGLTSVSGSIQVAGDTDFFELQAINTQWGFLAALDNSASTTGRDAIVSVYDSDGTTLLQQDLGGWTDGSVLTWQHFQAGTDTPIFIKVEASDSEGTISDYTLRIYIIAIGEEGEIEPNNTWETGNIAGKSNLGTISDDTDADCYRLSGTDDKTLIVALRADPENDGSQADFVLSLYDASGHLMTSADHSGPGGNEFIDSIPISQSIYSYCVTTNEGAGNTASYKVGALIDDYNYLPTWDLQTEWLNPGLGDVAIPGDIMDFRLSVANTTLLPIPPEIRVGVNKLPTCLLFDDTSSFDYVGSDSANKLFVDELEAGASYMVDFSVEALTECNDFIHESVSFLYYVLGVGTDTAFTVVTYQCETITLQIAAPTYSDEGATYYSSEAGIEISPDTPSKITVESPHKLILEAPSIMVKDGAEFVVQLGAQLRAYGKAVICP